MRSDETKKPKTGKKYVRRITLDSLVLPEGTARKLRVTEKRKDSVKEDQMLIPMTVRGLRNGSVCLETQDGAECFCTKDHAKGVLYGDNVLVKRISGGRVKIVKVIQRAHEQIVGVLREKRGVRFMIPLEKHLPQGISVRPGGEKAQDGDVVLTKVVRWEDEGGLLVRIEGRIGSFSQTSGALDALIVAGGFRTDFPPEVMEQAGRCQEARLEDDPCRLDLRDLCTFTIDGLDAKDFDDAVSLETLDDGCIRLGVHIADVGYYIPQGSPLDREAYLRGTSVYFPGRVLPMLPERLSNGVCSLRPNEDKFTLSALMDIDASGAVVRTRFERTITRSKARLVYDDVNALLAGDPAQQEAMKEFGQTLRAMQRLAERIRGRRQANGAIDFDTMEPKFVLDEQGEPIEIINRERGEAEMMIEDFMLTANEAVARYAKNHGLPILYRVHENPDPEKLSFLKSYLEGLGVDARSIRKNAKPGDIRAILEKTKDSPEYRVISSLALRSMQKARYDVRPLGHYGIALEDYCHFTSPIRRYPDLLVSRALTAALLGKRAKLTGEALEDAAMRSSDCERAAVEAERAADKMMTARLMKNHIGDLFDGTVSGVCEWGVYVLLDNGAEGFIHVRTLDDWFDYDDRRMTLRGERTGFVFSLGQSLCVRVENVELENSAVDLVLADPLRRYRREKSERKKERKRMRSFGR